jgi:hypothetical protein
MDKELKDLNAIHDKELSKFSAYNIFSKFK